jgi:hypothetical protein
MSGWEGGWDGGSDGGWEGGWEGVEWAGCHTPLLCWRR